SIPTGYGRQAGAFAGCVGHHDVVVEEEAHVEDAAKDEQQHGHGERELDELRAPRGKKTATHATSRCQRNHIAPTVPTRIGTAYARRGLVAVSSVSCAWGLKPATRQ